MLNKINLVLLMFFSSTGYSFQQQAYVKASNAEKLDEFGRSVAISGGTMVVGAWNESSNALGVDGNEIYSQQKLYLTTILM